MKKINHRIQEIQSNTKTAQSFLTDQSFAAYKDDYHTQGKILDNLKQAQDKCYDLGRDLVKQFGWNQPETPEDLFYLLQEQVVIDSDLVDRMIAIFRIRWDLIEDNLEKGDYKLVDEILQQNFEDMNLLLKQVKEFTSAAISEQKKIFEQRTKANPDEIR